MLGDKPFVLLGFLFLYIYFFYIFYRLINHNFLGLNTNTKLLFYLTIFTGLFITFLKLPAPYSLIGIITSFSSIYFSKLYQEKEIWLKSGLFIFSAFSLNSLLLWWKFNPRIRVISADQLIPYITVIIIFIGGIILLNFKNLTNKNYNKFLFLIYFVIASTYCINTASLVGTSSTWHNWSAYVGPAQLFLTKAVPFFDFPMQYGFGPTYIISLLCSVDCWEGVWIFTVITTIVTISLSGLICLILLEGKKLQIKIIALLGLLSTFLFWTTYPALILPITNTPSTVGPRFMPGIIVLFAIVLWCAKYRFSRTGATFIHTLWLTTFLWSPEAFIHATMLWVPIFLMHRSSGKSSKNKLVTKAFQIFLLLGLLIFIIFLVWWGVFGVIFDFRTYFLYILHPPGTMPIDPTGVVLYLIFVLFIGFKCFSDLPYDKNKIFLMASVLFFMMATSTYFLGRSHENNALNILPYVYLTIISIISFSSNLIITQAAFVSLLAVIAFIPALGNNGNGFTKPDISSYLRNYSFNPNLFESDFKRCSGSGNLQNINVHGNDYQAASLTIIKAIKNISLDPIQFYDRINVLDGCELSPWVVFHAPLNWEYIPLNYRFLYAQRYMLKVRKSGWFVFDRSLNNSFHYLTIIDKLYMRADVLSFKQFEAIRFVPK